MALIDVVVCNSPLLCWKFPSTDLRIGTQLVVHPSRVAFFVKGGKIYDMFDEGTHTLTTNNIPLLNKLINIPFGGNTPFQAEVWFVNLVAKLDIKWGTPNPIQVEDPLYNVIVPMRAFGQYGLRVINPENFLRSFVGNASATSIETMDSYFKGKILSHLSALISKKVTQDKVSVLQINSHLVELSEYCDDCLDKVLEKWGLEVLEFSIQNINIPQDDPTVIKLKEAKDMAARMKIAGKDVYQMQRSFDVMEHAAKNEGVGGQFTSMGAGLGAGLGVGGAMGTMFGQNLNTNPQPMPPPMPQAAQYFVHINGTQHGPYPVQMILPLIQSGQANEQTLCWKQGMANWQPLKELPDFAAVFSVPPPVSPQAPPPLPPSQG